MTEGKQTLRTARSFKVYGWCETCGRLFYTATSAKKLCDVPTCRGYIHHV